MGAYDSSPRRRGAALARLEAQIAFGRLTRHSIELDIPRAEVEWMYSSIHGPRSLPIRFT